MPELVVVPGPSESPGFKPGYVERGRELVKAGESTAWELGDYILEGFPIGEHGVNTAVKDGLKALAAEIGGEPETLTQYRKVAHSWPEGTRVPSATWAAHRAYCGPPASAPARRAPACARATRLVRSARASLRTQLRTIDLMATRNVGGGL